MKTKHFSFIAAAIRDAKLKNTNQSADWDAALRLVVNNIADAIEVIDAEKFPHKFDRKRFLEVCEGTDK